jgi:SAM-dependent methyltransferase
MTSINSEPIWGSIDELAEALQMSYSVTGKESIRKQYLSQVKQYPLYLAWFQKVIDFISKKKKHVNVLEYGSGPGILAEMLMLRPLVVEYTAIEPEKVFREMTEEITLGKAKIIESTAEEYLNPCSADLVVATAAYHHFSDKPKALQNIHENLSRDGELIIADVFLPDYGYDSEYNPVDRIQFIEKVLEYSAMQIKAMPNPLSVDIADQIKTTFLDILRIEELKVCVKILEEQLDKAGFANIQCELMKGKVGGVNYSSLGYYFITANRNEENVA